MAGLALSGLTGCAGDQARRDVPPGPVVVQSQVVSPVDIETWLQLNGASHPAILRQLVSEKVRRGDAFVAWTKAFDQVLDLSCAQICEIRKQTFKEGN